MDEGIRACGRRRAAGQRGRGVEIRGGRGEGLRRRGVRSRGGREGGQQERGEGPGGRRRQPRTIITDDMRATVIDHVIGHGMTMAEAGRRVHPNLSRFTVATIIKAFRQHNRYSTLLLSLSHYSFTGLWKWSVTLHVVLHINQSIDNTCFFL